MRSLKKWKQICGIQSTCNFVNDGFGRWTNKTWKPFSEDQRMKNLTRKGVQKLTKRLGTLWIYGDSTQERLRWAVIKSQLCKQLFKNCKGTYNHIYPVGSSIPSNDHIDVNRLMRYFDEVFSKREMRGQGNVVVLNVGLHLIRATGLRTALEIIDLYVTKATQHNARVIWRGQTSIGEKTRARLFIRSFQTNIRAMIINAYSIKATCKAGMPFFNTFPMTAAFKGRTRDTVHPHQEVYRTWTEILYSYLAGNFDER